MKFISSTDYCLGYEKDFSYVIIALLIDKCYLILFEHDKRFVNALLNNETFIQVFNS